MSFKLHSRLGAAGAAIPIYGTCTGHKLVPLWALASNSLGPKLRFFDAEVEWKVLKTARRPWSEIESVDAQLLWKTSRLTLNFQGTPWNVSANLLSPADLRETLRFLNAKGLSLTPRAQEILNS